MAQLQLRIPPDVHERAKAAAKEDRRSLNGELLWLIELGLEHRQQLSRP
ncbi:MAG TPA: toxin-antitoxin system HicB family antitoxin [Dermatophilaceae bacterium]